MLREHPRGIALVTDPIGIFGGIEVPMMGKMVLAIRSRRDQVRPRQQDFGSPIVKPAVSKQPVMYPLVHQNEQRVLPRTDKRNHKQIKKRMPEALAQVGRAQYQRPFGRDMKTTSERK